MTTTMNILDEYRLKAIIKKYSDFIRYPIKMDMTGKRPKEGSESEFEDYQEEQNRQQHGADLEKKQKRAYTGRLREVLP